MLRIIFASIAILLAVAAGPVSAQSQLVPSTSSGDGGDTGADSADDAIDTLLSIIKDEQARNALIDRLEGLETQGAGDGERATAAGSAEDASVARRLAEVTTGAVQAIYENASLAWRDLSGISQLFETLPESGRERMSQNALPMLGTIVVTVALLMILNRISSWLIHPRRFHRSSHRWIRILVSVGCNVASDLVALVLAYAAGYVVAITVFGSGSLKVEQALYLNAFLITGIFYAVIRIFVRPRRPDYALLSLSRPVQSVVQTWLVFLSGFLIYGLTVAIPVANLWSSFLVGRALRVIVTTLGVVLALIAIRRIARMMNIERRTGKTEDDAGEAGAAAEDTEGGPKLTFWHHAWPWIAVLYVLVSYVIAIGYPALMTQLIVSATIKTVVAAAVLALSVRLLGSARKARFRMPGWMERSLPSFDDKVNILLPIVLQIIAFMLIVSALIFMLDAWQILDVETWLGRDRVTEFAGRAVSALLIVAFVVLLWAMTASWIDTRLSLDLPGRNVTARTRTLLSLFKNAVTVAAVIFGAMMGLSQLGIDIAPLLAGAGVIGLAIGFGAQKLVQDIITGIFIQLENAINEGDVVTVAGKTGAVEKLTIRSVGVRDLDGIYHIVPFSAVDTVSNFMRLFSYHVAVIGVAYKEYVPEVKQAMRDAFDRLRKMDEGAAIIDDFEMHGVVELADSSVNVRARIKTLPGQQWAVGRAYTEMVKEVFDERGIEIPFPHRVVFHRRDGESEPAPQMFVGANPNVETDAPPASEDEL